MSDWKFVDSGSTFDLEDDLFFRVQQCPGTGMPPVSNIRSDYGILDGALFQRQRTETRSFQLIGTLKGDTVANLHSRRRALIDRVKMDRSGSQQPTVVQYLGSGSTLQASGFYVGGLEFGDVSHNIEADIALGFEMLDPYWEATTATSATLTINTYETGFNGIAQRDPGGYWRHMASGVGASETKKINTIVSGCGGKYFVGGTFDDVTGDAGGCNMAMYDSSASTWSEVWGGANSQVKKLVIGPDGATLYVLGDFDTVGGSVSACRLASVNNGVWSDLAASPDDSLYDMSIGPDGRLWVVGEITNIGGTAASGIAVYDPAASTWSDVDEGVGQLSPNRTLSVRTMTWSLDKKRLYIGGAFDIVGSASTTACAVAWWDDAASTWSGCATQTASTGILAMTTGLNGIIYSASVEHGNSQQKITSWNGTKYEKLAQGLNQTVYKMATDPVNGDILAVGKFLTLADLSFNFLDGFARWNQSVWNVGGGINITQGDFLDSAVLAEDDGTLTIGWSVNAGYSGASTAAVTQVTNPGTAEAYPIFTASGPGRLYKLTNFTTNQDIYFDLDLLNGETVTLDLRTGRKTFESDFRGNILHTAIRPGSRIVNWRILPGVNNISLYMENKGGAAALEWTSRYWSLDGSA